MFNADKLKDVYSSFLNGRKIVNVWNYSDEFYLVEAPVASDEIDYGDPFYLAKKDGSGIGAYPIIDISDLLKITSKPPIYSAMQRLRNTDE